jgi:outer membrane biosynthesis protein TonB
VSNVKVPGGNDVLKKAAVAAVRKWRHSPAVFNPKPVSVIATVTVKLHLW